MFKKLREKFEPAAGKSKKLEEIKRCVVIDYPKENEMINHPSYTVKITAGEEGSVEISIDGGDWQHCRQAEGFWWYDWANYPSMPHKIIARLHDNKGKILEKSEIRTCIS